MPKEKITRFKAHDPEDGYVHPELSVHWGYGHVQVSLAVNGDNVRDRATDLDVSKYHFFSDSLTVDQIDLMVSKLKRAKVALLRDKGDIDVVNDHREAVI